MGTFIVGQGNKQNTKTQPGTSIQVRTQQPAVRRASPNTPNIQVRAKQPPMMRPPAQPPRPMQPGGGLGQAPAAGYGTHKCVGCGKYVTPKVDGFTTPEEEGLRCRDCWAHIWVKHPYANVAEGPPCSMGVRFTPTELNAIQDVIFRTVKDVGGATGNFPSTEQMDVVLGSIKKSLVCNTCHKDIVFSLDSKDFVIAGVNAQWPQGTPLPWQQQQQAMAPQYRR